MGPTGAILWEIWGRRKWNFACHLAALVAAAVTVQAIQTSATEIVQTLLKILLLGMFMGTCVDLVTAFAFIEVNAQTVQFGFPIRLLLKPVTVRRLALTPMLVGGVALVSLLALWKWILAPLLPRDILNPLWLGGVTLSFFWWMQALGWGLPYFPARSLVLLLAATVHLLVGLIPKTPFSSLLRWGDLILGLMLASAIVTAVHGLKWMRQGRWEGPSRLHGIWRKLAPALVLKLSQEFGSPFRAQFWLEWQRQGRVLPAMCFPITAVILPVIYEIQKQSIDPGTELDFATVAMAAILVIPLMLSGAMGTAMARFDSLRPAGDLPVYISVRPMTNGDFVITKLAVALLSSAVTWLLMFILMVVWLVISKHGALVPKGAPFGFVGLAIGCVPALILLILLTWNNLVSGIAAGLTGRPWVIGVFAFGKGVGGVGLFALLLAAKFNTDFKESLLHWLPALLGLSLIGKIAFSVVSFRLGLRRNAITRGVIGWIIGGWLAGGLFIAAYAALICQALNKPNLCLWIALGGLLFLPLADLAIAPLAMAWNRHR